MTIPKTFRTLLLPAILLAGCATRMAPSQRAYVYIAENTAITYGGETFLQVLMEDMDLHMLKDIIESLKILNRKNMSFLFMEIMIKIFQINY